MNLNSMTHHSTILLATLALAISSDLMADEKRHDVVVYGGTAGGVVAATSAALAGRSVVLIEPGKHLGGMTGGGLGATDYGKPIAVGGMSRDFYRRVKKHYQDPASWKYEKREDYRPHQYKPEDDDVLWHFEPHVAEKIFAELLREAGVTVVFGERLNRAAGVAKSGSRIVSITTESGKLFPARVFIDATYEGDLMATAGVSYHVGREGNAAYGETLNGVQTKRVPYSGHNVFRPLDPYVIPGVKTSGLLFGVQAEPPGEEGAGDHRVQAYCFRLCMTDVPENRLPFPKPDSYDPKTYELLLRYLLLDGSDKTFPEHPSPGKIENPALGRDPNIRLMPNRKTDMNTKGAISSNFVGQNYSYPDADYGRRDKIIDAHRRWHQGMVWFIQNDPRVPAHYRDPLQNWGLPKDEFTDNNNWPHQLYIREARRMIGDYVMVEQDCTGERRCEDSVGLGSYTMDSHITQRFVNSTGHVRNEGTLGGKVPAPYPISYRSMTPKREQCDNLLVPVCMSASHVAYGSIRMEPVYMILGQSAGTAAAMAIEMNLAVQEVPYAPLRTQLLADKQRLQ
jgi:hypothetical protein